MFEFWESSGEDGVLESFAALKHVVLQLTK